MHDWNWLFFYDFMTDAKCKICEKNPAIIGWNSCKCPTLCQDCCTELAEKENSEKSCLSCSTTGSFLMRLLRRSSLASISKNKCYVCHMRGKSSPACFSGDACGCLTLCFTCARNCATGGVCHKCNNPFMTVMRRL